MTKKILAAVLAASVMLLCGVSGTGVLIGFTHKCRKIKGFRRST